jgi:hypothetical protein
LNDHRGDGDDSESLHPPTIFDNEESNTQSYRDQSNTARDQPMRMLKEDSSHPARYREQKHVIAEAVWPVWDCHPGFMTGYQPTTTDQKQNARRSRHGIPMQ